MRGERGSAVFKLFKNNKAKKAKRGDVKPPENIEIISKPEPNACGGTYAYRDHDLKKTVESRDVVYFSATSALGNYMDPNERLGWVSAFAVKAQVGSFVFLGTSKYSGGRAPSEKRWALVKEDVFPRLADLTENLKLAEHNGYFSRTAGLPEDFGGSVEIKYASGERIAFSDNQSPILRSEQGREIAALFKELLTLEPVHLPSADGIREVRFCEKRKDGGFTETRLTIDPDGSGENVKKQRFSEPRIYESSKRVEKETVDKIRETVSGKGLLIWAYLPDSGYEPLSEKTLTFVFDSGEEITVKDARAVPDPLRGAFFDVELELTTKN